MKPGFSTALDRYPYAPEKPLALDETVFVAPDIVRRSDAGQRKDRLAQLVAAEIVPRLVDLHRTTPLHPDGEKPSEAEIVELAHLVLGPRLQAAAQFVTVLRERGVSMEMLFIDLLQPAARHLGKMWDNDECDFIDVTLGVGQLQSLLAVFNCTHDLPQLGRRRRVLLSLTPGEQHSFGLDMVAKLMRAAGWDVNTGVPANRAAVAAACRSEWYAVAGFTLGSDQRIDELAAAIAAIRDQSRNSAIGIMVGGPPFIEDPSLVARVGADATALDATTAVILAQKLFDVGAKTNWAGTGP